MKTRSHLLVVSLFVSLLVATPAPAQDASQVLALSVSFGTLKNSTKMTDAMREEVAQLETQARTASRERRYADAIRIYNHAMATLRGQAWTPSRAMSIAMRLRPDRVILEPSEALHLQVSQTFTLDEPVKASLSGVVSIAAVIDGKVSEFKSISALANVQPDFVAKPYDISLTVPDVLDGAYQIKLALSGLGIDPIEKTAGVRIYRGVSKQALELRRRLEPLKARSVRGVDAAEYSASLVDLINRGAISPGSVDLKQELSNAAVIVDQLAKGENPLKSKRGDFRWAYRSTVDQELQPYRVYVPQNHEPAKTWPLVVALHGMGGDENSLFDGYSNGRIKQEAEARGYLIVCPKGRGSASMYRGDAERDVMDVLAEMKKDYSIDPDRTYLMGHSMGGYGTWSVAMAYPSVFAALAPISGGGQPAGMTKIAHIPQFVVHGDADPTVSVEESRRMVKAGRDLGAEVQYVEVPGGDHSSVAVPHFKQIFDWFDAHRRKPRG
jgi:predicted esterase